MMERLLQFAESISTKFNRSRTERKFCRANKKFWNEWRRNLPAPDPQSVVVSEFEDNNFMVVNNAIPATVIAAVKGAYTLCCSKKKTGAMHLRGVRKSFGRCYFSSIEELAGPDEKKIQETAKALFNTLTTPASVLELRFDGMLIGDLVYDSAMRHGFWQASLWEVNERVLREIVICLRAIHAADALCKIYRVKGALFSHMVNTYAGAMLRRFVYREIESYQGNNRVLKHLSFNGCRLPHPFKQQQELLDAVLAQREAGVLAAAQENLDRRFSGTLDHFDAKRAFSADKKIYQTRETFCAEFGLDAAKPCVFVMLHAFNDFPHHFEKNAFRDYYEWFLATLHLAKTIESVNWIFKQHPSSKAYPDDANLAGIFSVIDQPHIKFIDSDVAFNSASLRFIAHAIVTCLGTAGLEFSCFGIPAVLAGESWYTGFGICHECFEENVYAETLRKIKDLPRLNESRQKMARIVMYLATADADKSRFFALPPYSHEERSAAKLNKVLDYVIKHQNTPEHLESLQTFREFVANPAAQHYLNPINFRCLAGLPALAPVTAAG